MNPERYRLKTARISDFSGFLDNFRAEAMRVLGRKYGALVAVKAVSSLDDRKMGCGEFQSNPIKTACEIVRNGLGASDGILAPDLNCIVRFHVVKDAVLAEFVHGDHDFKSAWDGMRDVVKWGWHAGERPPAVSEVQWENRRKYWEPTNSKSGFALGLNFILIERDLPDLGWGAIRRYVPDYETRIEMAIARLKKLDPAGSGRLRPDILRSRVVAQIDKKIDKESFSTRARVQSSGARQIRNEVAKARAEEKSKRKEDRVDDGRVATIDHADIIVAKDGRIFMAVPYVGLDSGERVFVQVGDNHIGVSQGGLQYGHVTDVKKSALDLLRTCKSVTLVEVDPKGGKRLLRAKHVSIVSDISLSMSFNAALGPFKRPGTNRVEQEIKEWDSTQ